MAPATRFSERDAREILRVRSLFRSGCVTRFFHKARKLLVGDLSLVHPETLDTDSMHGLLVGLAILRTHPEKRPRESKSCLQLSYLVFAF